MKQGYEHFLLKIAEIIIIYFGREKMKNILQIVISLLFLFAIQVSTSPTEASFTKIDPEKELCEDTSDENRNEDKILKICKVKNRTDGNELQTYSQPYEVTAEEFIFEQISLKCTEKSEANCGVRFNAIKLIKITESDIVASSIDFIGEEAELIMCAKSGLSTKGMGFIRGKGTQGGFGGSYAGQGGVGNRLEKEMTYGSFSQEPEFYKFHNNQMGSGGSIGNNKGGGVVVIKVKTASINGRIVADGSPDSKTDIIKNYEGASGGYIYISCKSQSYLGHKAIISANGGIGNSDETINGLSGSGGRIVLSNIT